jgi:hypothetical protein
MIRLITSFVLIGIAVATFFVFANPLYSDISQLQVQSAFYNEALTNSKALENERDKLTAKYNTIAGDNLTKIKKLLPDNIDNIRLILEIGKIALPYGMVLKNVKYNVVEKTDAAATSVQGAVQGGNVAAISNKDYGIWNLEFSTEGTYNNFLNFLRDLESNLRIVDISSITFSSDVGVRPGSFLPDVYTYDFKIKTYWLKN